MKTSDFAYDLPEELIAQDPLSDRASSRLMILDKQTGEITHRIFRDITEYLKPGDCLVLNDTKVIPARLIGEREETGGKVEVLLLKRGEDNVWETLVKPGKKARPGTRLVFGGGLLRAEVVDIVEEGNRLIRFEYEGIFEEILDQLGQMPLPPYITHKLEDKNRYQTVYAKYEGSAAAPTAGLHFTTELLQQIEQMGVSIARVTLHVGLGTFRPVKVDDVEQHHMHTEFYRVTKEAADQINQTKQAGGRIICVGTTSCRTIESATDDNGVIQLHARAFESSSSFMATLVTAPVICSTVSPFLKSTRVGIARMPNLVGVAGFSSTFILTTRTLPSYSLASSSMIGPTARQGPHQGAQKSSRTGRSDLRTRLSKVASVTCSAILITP